MENSKTNKILVGLILVLAVLFMVQTCRNRTGNLPTSTSITTIDTTHVSHVDTIPFYNIIDSIRWKNLTVISSYSNSDSSEFTYITDMSDSLLAGTINTKVKSDGTLVNQGFTYIPKFPKYITRTDTFWINKETVTTINKPNWGIYGGLMVSPYKNFSMIGTVGIKTKKDMYFGIGYEPFRNNIYLDFKVSLFHKK